MKRITPFLWSIALIVALGLGLWGGWAIARGYDKPEITRLQNELGGAKGAAQASLAKAKAEVAFWELTLRILAEGGQLEGVELNGRPSLGD